METCPERQHPKASSTSGTCLMEAVSAAAYLSTALASYALAMGAHAASQTAGNVLTFAGACRRPDCMLRSGI